MSRRNIPGKCTGGVAGARAGEGGCVEFDGKMPLNRRPLFLSSGNPWNKALILCSVEMPSPATVQLVTIPAFEGQDAHAELLRNRHCGSDF